MASFSALPKQTQVKLAEVVDKNKPVPLTGTDSGILAQAKAPVAAAIPATAAAPVNNSSFIATPATKTTASGYTAKDWKPQTNELVSNQVNDITKSGSPLMELAKTQGLQQANQRGLLNSSMGIGAAQNAVIQNALPMAQGNADVMSKAAYNNAAAANTAASFNAQQAQQNNQFNASNVYNANAAVFDANTQASLKQLENEFQFTEQSQRIYGELLKTFGLSMQDINRDTNMNQQSKDYSIKQQYELLKSSMSLLSSVDKIPDISDLLVEV